MLKYNVQLNNGNEAFVAGEHTGGGADGRYFLAVSAVLLHERRTAAVGINDYDYDNEKS